MESYFQFIPGLLFFKCEVCTLRIVPQYLYFHVDRVDSINRSGRHNFDYAENSSNGNRDSMSIMLLSS